MNDKETIVALAKSVKVDMTIGEFAGMVCAAINVKDEEGEIRKAEAKVEAALQAELKALADRRLANRERCKHWVTTYHPDVSGNNDSWTDCKFCGKEM